ncbi:MAG: nitrile hydratase subunit alpha [Rhodospirillaceae bacterium]|jgi:nitrile hydratase subunit alpha|nr:nitrile hydratase subunit alpha [Rhodospirillaceae bacterium]MBT6511915.1 nitrile hydratase subunit alpha [Rhodospirillaceae bacterium]MBT7646682.1 nitrile hydratase subunit alpha [Rhodospirillaceae bacterium]
MNQPHDHDHQHPHPFQPDDDAGEPTHHMQLVRALRELLIEKGIYDGDEERQAIERMVARAWADPTYKERLLANGAAAAEEIGVEVGPTRLIVVENTEQLHNVIVCTLCSCYPRWVLGLPPAWYKARAYRSRVVVEPRPVLAEFGTELGGDMEVRVHDSTADMRYMVLPARPAGTEGWSEEALTAIITRDCMIGVTVPQVPSKHDPH